MGASEVFIRDVSQVELHFRKVHSFLFKFSKCLLSACCIPGTVLGPFTGFSE